MALGFTHDGTIYIVLDEENLARVQQHDPFEIDFSLGNPGPMAIPPRIAIAYARRDEQDTLTAMKDDVPALIRYLFRGYRYTETDASRRGPYQQL
jgi:hypothetical protein